ncbi:MAG: radical SAM family heme chaperone HemW [Phormidesmis sp.]
MATSAYIHIPFCRRRCYYCDFAISVVGDRARGDTSNTISQYIDTLIQEIRATPIASDKPLQTVFFGGGTPSLLSAAQLNELLSALYIRFGIAPTAEISMEMDPATFELPDIEGYQAAGINRVSLGAQAFQDDILAACGRFHRSQDIFRAVELLQQAQINNFSLDLISGLPHQTLAHWQSSLEQAVELAPTHLSHYDLIVEPQTAFGRYFTPGEAPLPSDEHTARMYRVAQAFLSAQGYEHYEICNYAKPGYEARHNLTYWHSQPCYGFGMGATSYINHQRIERPRTQRTYREWVERFIRQKGRTPDPVLPPAEQVIEGIMVGLRLKQGISLEAIYQMYGERGLAQMEQALAPHLQAQRVIIDAPLSDRENITKLEPTSRIRLSDPEGFLMSNQVIVDAFNAIEAPRNR